jgi:hypothetical protein
MSTRPSGYLLPPSKSLSAASAVAPLYFTRETPGVRSTSSVTFGSLALGPMNIVSCAVVPRRTSMWLARTPFAAPSWIR